jgi:hypothetical protein
VTVKATKRAIATAMRVASNNEGNGDGNFGEQATTTRVMAVVTTGVGEVEGGGTAMRVACDKEGEGSMALVMVMVKKDGGQAMATKRAVAMAMRVAGRMRAMARAAREMAMATKRAIVRKRVMASNDNNETMATETMVINTMKTMTRLMMMMKTTTKMATTTVWRWQLAVAGGSEGGEQTWRQHGLMFIFFYLNCFLGVI